VPRVPSYAAAYIGERIVEERLRLALTQDQLAAASGIDSANIRAHEKGRSMPSILTLVRLATALNVEPGALLEGLTLDHFAANEKRASRALG
jgi:transcriptional regulator with XRE-family HTH domain